MLGLRIAATVAALLGAPPQPEPTAHARQAPVSENRPRAASGTGAWRLAADIGWASYGFHPDRLGPEWSLDAQATIFGPGRWKVRIGPRLGYGYTPAFAHALAAGARLSAPWVHPSGFVLEPSLATSYRHHWSASPNYRLNDDGLSRKVPRGTPGMETALALGLGYDSPRHRVFALVGYEVSLLAPFLPQAGVPVFMASSVWLRVGVRIGPKPKGRQ